MKHFRIIEETEGLHVGEQVGELLAEVVNDFDWTRRNYVDECGTTKVWSVFGELIVLIGGKPDSIKEQLDECGLIKGKLLEFESPYGEGDPMGRVEIEAVVKAQWGYMVAFAGVEI